MMTIRSAKFVLSLDRLRAFPGQGMPEIAMEMCIRDRLCG